MSLKRGLERVSCDFCFRRKVKCDRSSRARAGHACSQCDLRQTPCTFDSDDVRIQRRRRESPKSSYSNAGAQTPTDTETRQGAGPSIVSDDERTHAENSAIALDDDALFAPFSNNAAINATVSIGSSLSVITTSTTQSQATDFSVPNFPDFDFELSPESISFLDSVFIRNYNTTEPNTVWGNMLDPAPQDVDEQRSSLTQEQNPYLVSDIDTETLEAAIEAYFSFASLALPILYKDAFMIDYNDRRSSLALVFAVACRGSPFVQTKEKWALQQRLASRFRDAYLQARSVGANQEVIRLDDLEALALMVGFDYEKSEDPTSPLYSQLENLFLTHDSLVLMTQQYRIETCRMTSTGLSTVLSRAAERHTILFWYVYGLDAFNSLDRKVASRIRDEDVDLSGQLPGHESRSYFDAILGLAIIARRMTRALRSPIAKRNGVKHQDVESFYKQLEEWHINICPLGLRTRAVDSTSLSSWHESGFSPKGTERNNHLPLHQAVVALLELNCYMQIEDCISQYGIEDRGSHVGQIVDIRVEYESLQAVYKIVDVAQWLERLAVSGPISSSTVSHVLVDLAPGILRDICAGASTWLFLRAKRILQKAVNQISHSGLQQADCPSSNENDGELAREQVRSLMKSAVTLRNIAATAISHKDTKPLIERLDEQLRCLKEFLEAH
ncbi:hypothetical protein F5Y19DRAFT_285808 [Xylariaceae sp. FL1651]|nr:hypothetical protein F5Y19DRAFT_285808 [Xylariaceae sp. FL1651]